MPGGARSGKGPLSPVQESPGGVGMGGGGLVSDSVPTSMFSCPGAAGFRVRGPTYLQDKKKVGLPLYALPLGCCWCIDTCLCNQHMF